ncbi:Uncharacterised protein [Mycobacteroides abscessus subsp. abscessus]|nr:Uncharacterised protein [Mycobacteroides abscessus subsp. abscessus]
MTANAMTAAEHGLHPPAYDWPHNGMFETFDHASIRRGFQVYKERDQVNWLIISQDPMKTNKLLEPQTKVLYLQICH